MNIFHFFVDLSVTVNSSGSWGKWRSQPSALDNGQQTKPIHRIIVRQKIELFDPRTDYAKNQDNLSIFFKNHSNLSYNLFIQRLNCFQSGIVFDKEFLCFNLGHFNISSLHLLSIEWQGYNNFTILISSAFYQPRVQILAYVLTILFNIWSLCNNIFLFALQ